MNIGGAESGKGMGFPVFVVVAVASLLRLFLSAELTDEANYVAHAYTFLLDGRLFESDLFIQGTAAVLIAPLVWLYREMFQAEGLVLFLRLLYFAWALGAALASYGLLKRFYPKDLAWAAASFFLAFIPFAIPSWSYNTVPAFGAPMALFLLFRGTTIGAVLGGLVAAASCFAYPPISLMFGALLVWLWSGRGSLDFRSRATFTLMIVAGGAASALFLWQGRANLPLVAAFTKEFEWVGGFGKVAHIGYTFYKAGWRSGLWVFVLLGLIFYFRKRRDAGRAHDFWLIAGAMAWALLARVSPQRTMGFLIFAPCSLMVFHALGRLPRTSRQRPPVWLLAFGLMAAAIQGYTSSNILVNASLGMILPLQILLLEALMSLHETGRAGWLRIRTAVAAVAFTLVAGNYLYVYRDEKVLRLSEMVASGPYRYLWTTGERRAMLESLDRDLKDLAANHGSVFSAYLTPAYFSAPLKPVTGMLFIHESQWRQSALDLILHRTLKGEWPDVVVNKIIDQPDFDYQFEKFFLASGRYQATMERPWYRILTRVAKSGP